MRRIGFRDCGDSNWGLAPFGLSECFYGLFYAAREVLRYLRQPLERRRLRRYLKARRHLPAQVSLGSGRSTPDGWVGLDFKRRTNVFACDLRRPLPFASGSVDAVLAEHVLEHLHFDDAQPLLLEVFRVLRPGAPLRVVCPDASIVLDILAGRSSERASQQLAFDAKVHGWSADETLPIRAAFRVTYQFGQHHMLITADVLATLLRQAGFCGVEQVEVSKTRYFGLPPGTHLERFPESAFEAVVFEAVKPSDGTQSQLSSGSQNEDSLHI